LDPGTYRFEVKAREHGATWGAPTRIDLALAAPPWRSAWAYLGYALLAAAVLFAVAWEVRSRVADRRRAEGELRGSEQRLKLALWGTGDELWDADLRTGGVQRQNPLPHMKRSGTVRVGTLADVQSYVHPEDAKPFLHALTDHLAGRSDSFESNFRIRDD